MFLHQSNGVLPNNDHPRYSTIEEAWATTGYDEKKKTRDPLCQLYGDQFRKVQNALWQSKFPEFEQYFPFEKVDAKPTKAPRKKDVTVAPDTTADDERLLERYIENGEVAAAPVPLSIGTVAPPPAPPPAVAAAAAATTSVKSQIMELVMFVACGLLLIALLDLFFRIGFSYGQRSAT